MTPDEHARLTSSTPPAAVADTPPPTPETSPPAPLPPPSGDPVIPFTDENPPVGATMAPATATETRSEPATGGHRAGHVITRFAQFWLFVLRIAIGFVFLWAFLDKTFGWGYATTTDKAWVNGGSPTKGFLGNVNVGPLQSQFHSMAGTWWADWSFMLALALLGVALILGIALRPAAVGGTILLAMMWLAVYPPSRFDASGAMTNSSNPFVDDHVLEALIIIVLAATNAGLFFGLSGLWRRLPLIRRAHWLW